MKIYTIPVGFLGTNCYAVTDDKMFKFYFEGNEIPFGNM